MPFDAVLKPVPVTVTAVLPAAGPPVGVMLVTLGCIVNGTLLLSPLCVPTASATVPTPGGLTTVQSVNDVHLVSTTLLLEPKITHVGQSDGKKFVPSIVITVPSGPAVGEIEVIVGAPRYV